MTFVKGVSGHPSGKPKGAKDRYPRAAKKAVQALLDQFAGDTALMASVINRGLAARAPSSFPYLRLIVEQQLGLPDQTVNLKDKVVLAPRD